MLSSSRTRMVKKVMTCACDWNPKEATIFYVETWIIVGLDIGRFTKISRAIILMNTSGRNVSMIHHL